ncbi:MAG: sigma-70 family RNA polymerase sigma factor [Proteobacteria bacterium]|nr:sigma-70 family RNA polymerase sigma factor [Pseudomonadota bacterium]
MTAHRESFEREVLPHVETLNALAMRYTHNESEADDLVQDVLMRAFRSFDSFEPGTRCIAWLSCIMRNTFINRYRVQKREKAMMEGIVAECSGSVGESASADKTLEAEDMAKVGYMYAFSDEMMRAMNGLSEEFRVIITLADLLDFSYREISEKLRIPIGTVMSRLSRARQTLRKNLSEYAFAYGYESR